MAATVSDTRTIVHTFDDTTNLVSSTGAGFAVYTADPDPLEGAGSVGTDVSTEIDTVEVDLVAVFGAAQDLSNQLLYIATQANGTMDTLVNGGLGIVVSDGTNTVAYHLAGSDAAGFRWETGPVRWQMLILDTTNLPANKTQHLGTADPNFAAATTFGIQYKTLAKALGGTENCFTDIARWGTSGLIVLDGTSTSPAVLDDIASADLANTAGYGILRKLGAGLYSAQGPLTFGDNVGTGSVYAAETSSFLAFEDRNLSSGRYSLKVVSNATGTTYWRVGELLGTDQGQNGVTYSAPIGQGATFDASDPNNDTVLLYGSVFNNFEGGVLLSADSTNAPNHACYGMTFNNCGQIDPGLVPFKNCTIASSAAAATGAVLLDADGSANWAGLTFNSGGTGHAIYITATGTYDFIDFYYNGYGADGTADAVVYNNSGGAVTINVSGGDTPTVLNGTGATTTVNSSVPVTITVVDRDNNPVNLAQTSVYLSADGTEVLNADTDASGVVSTTFGGVTPADVYIRVRKSSPGDTRYKPASTTGTIQSGSGLSTTIVLQEDPNVDPNL